MEAGIDNRDEYPYRLLRDWATLYALKSGKRTERVAGLLPSSKGALGADYL